MGYYGGTAPARSRRSPPSATLPQSQPACLTDAADRPGRLRQLGRVRVLGGARRRRLRHLLRQAGRGPTPAAPATSSSSCATTPAHSDLLFQTSDTTWQAYNNYGGNSLYTGAPAGRAYKVSYNRPFITARAPVRQDCALQRRVPDGALARGQRLRRQLHHRRRHRPARRALLRRTRSSCRSATTSTGPAAQRANVEAARDAGVHLAFFSGNEVFWKTRWENSIDGSATPYRTLVTYKETHANAKIDPQPGPWTGTWRDPRFSPPADGGRPENALTGTIFTVNCCTQRRDRRCPAADGQDALLAQHRRGAARPPAQTPTLGVGTLGYEWDEDLDNGFRPAGLIRLSTTDPTRSRRCCIDYGIDATAPGTATHSLTLYRARRAARWSSAPARSSGPGAWTATTTAAAGRAADAAACSRRRSTCSPTWASSRHAAGRPGRGDRLDRHDRADLDDHLAGRPARRVQAGEPVDDHRHRGRRRRRPVGGVEVSVDGGADLAPARPGATSWSLHLDAERGRARRRSRAGPSTTAATSRRRGRPCHGDRRRRATAPARIWDDTADPGHRDATPTAAAVELGVKFRADVAGYITGVRFYKGAGNTGTHVGNLWTSAGTLLASGTFTGETASGWQQVDLRRAGRGHAPNTTYVASYSRRRRPLRRRRAATSRPPASTSRRCTRSANGADGRQRRLPLRRRRGFPTRPTARPTTGSTWSSTPARVGHDAAGDLRAWRTSSTPIRRWTSAGRPTSRLMRSSRMAPRRRS